MSKRTAFSRKSEHRHWRLLHEQEEAERQRRRVEKLLHRQDYRKAADHYAERGDAQWDRERDPDART